MVSGRSKYILGERIAQGGMAEIYLGKIVGSEGFTRLCAFKKVLPNYAEDAEFMEMFRNEAMVAKQLQNKNIVQVYDFESDFDQGPMLVMEYVDGQDLRSILRETEKARLRIPVEFAVYVAVEILNGLGYAHASVDISGKSLGIIHRDVSPQNILVSFEGDVKITDFGIAKVQSSASNTRAGVLKGKFRYMAPEQAKGESVDARADVFAMGIVLYEMLTMSRLFKGDDDFQVLQAVRECKIRPPNEIKGVSIPTELESIVLKLLAREPDNRYANARAAVKDLTRFLYSYRKDFFPGELAEFMQKIFSSKVDASRDRMRTTLALPIDIINSQVSQTSPRSASQLPDFLNGGGSANPSFEGNKRVGGAPISMGAPSPDVLALQSQFLDKPFVEKSVDGNNLFEGGNAFSQPPASRRIELAKPGAGDFSPQNSGPRANQGPAIKVGPAVQRKRNEHSLIPRAESRKKSGMGFQIFFLVFIVAAITGSAGFYFALKQRVIRFPSVIELKPYMETQRRVKVRVNGQAYQGGAWIDLPIQIKLEAGTHVIQIYKPGFKEFRTTYSAPLLGNTVFGTVKVESVLLGKDMPLGNVLVLTDPEGARISIDDGQFTGVSGRQIEFVPVGKRYKVRIEHSRCQTLVGELEMPASAAGEIFTKQFSLKGCR